MKLNLPRRQLQNFKTVRSLRAAESVVTSDYFSMVSQGVEFARSEVVHKGD